MFVVKCDLCRKNIKGKAVIAGFGILDRIELCEKCGAPILKFLKKHKIIKKENKKIEIKKGLN